MTNSISSHSDPIHPASMDKLFPQHSMLKDSAIRFVYAELCDHILPVFISADQVYGDQEMHSMVRSHCMDYMVLCYLFIYFHYFSFYW